MTNLRQLERNWFLKRVNIGSGQVSNNQLKRTYFNGQSFTGTLKDQEKQWLRSIIVLNSGIPSITKYTETLLTEALVILGVIPTQFLNANWIKLYATYNP